MSLLFILTNLLWAPVGAHAMVGAIDITDGAHTCVEEQLRARTVRFRADRAGCSGAMINDHELRTAGHCFTLARVVSGVRDVGGRTLDSGGAGAATVVGGQNWSASFDAPDHAAVRFDSPLAAVGPVELADVSAVPVDATVVMAGYGLSRPKRPLLKNLLGGPTKLKYYYGKLRVVRADSARRGLAFEVTPLYARSSIGIGDSGGPVFLVDGCRLQYLGTIVGRKLSLRGPTRVFVRPHADLPQ